MSKIMNVGNIVSVILLVVIVAMVFHEKKIVVDYKKQIQTLHINYQFQLKGRMTELDKARLEIQELQKGRVNDE